jgi:hypothetical protein
MFKNVTIGVLITVCIMFIFVVSVEGLASSKRIVELEASVSAHKLAMTHANSAIHTFYAASKAIDHSTVIR